MALPLVDLEQSCRDVGDAIGKSLPKGTGFALLVFEFGSGGHVTYISDADRSDLIALLRELIPHLERRMS